jgi:hypothetical protein
MKFNEACKAYRRVFDFANMTTKFAKSEKRVGILASSSRKCSFALLSGNHRRASIPRCITWYQRFSMTMGNGRLTELQFGQMVDGA